MSFTWDESSGQQDVKPFKREPAIKVVSVPCFSFIDSDGFKQRVTAIIAPIKIIMSHNTLLISWGCSQLGCFNKNCRYSRVKSQSASLSETDVDI